MLPVGWHLPGTVLLATDREGDYSCAFERILKGELYGAVRLKTEPELVSINFWESGRGRELEQLFFAETLATGDVPEGAFFPVDSLPDGTLEHYPAALEAGLEAINKADGES